ncbi:hypothetical protein ACU4GD_40860 [Cupriavidus basilensis]
MSARIPARTDGASRGPPMNLDFSRKNCGSRDDRSAPGSPRPSTPASRALMARTKEWLPRQGRPGALAEETVRRAAGPPRTGPRNTAAPAGRRRSAYLFQARDRRRRLPRPYRRWPEDGRRR